MTPLDPTMPAEPTPDQPCPEDQAMSEGVGSATTLAFLDRMKLPVGAVVHTLERGQPVKATHGEQGWVVVREGWVHD